MKRDDKRDQLRTLGMIVLVVVTAEFLSLIAGAAGSAFFVFLEILLAAALLAHLWLQFSAFRRVRKPYWLYVFPIGLRLLVVFLMNYRPEKFSFGEIWQMVGLPLAALATLVSEILLVIALLRLASALVKEMEARQPD